MSTARAGRGVMGKKRGGPQGFSGFGAGGESAVGSFPAAGLSEDFLKFGGGFCFFWKRSAAFWSRMVGKYFMPMPEGRGNPTIPATPNAADALAGGEGRR